MSQLTIGILALQGGYQAHASQFSRLGIATRWVYRAEDLATIDGLVIPGGESSVLLLLMTENGLLQPLQAFIANGKPVFGTCAGAIVLAKTATASQYPTLAAMDVEVTRNAFGRQLQSELSQGVFLPTQQALPMLFIRAPAFANWGDEVNTVAEHQGQAVCLQQGNCLAASFHPELTEDLTLHRYFLTRIKKYKSGVIKLGISQPIR